MGQGKQVSGRYEKADNVLHLWFPNPVHLNDVASVVAFFDEVTRDWIEPVQAERFHLLVNYQNLHIGISVVEAYAANIKRFQARLLGTFRYNVASVDNFTETAVRIGNVQLRSHSNVFPDEAAAREAIRRSARLQSSKKVLAASGPPTQVRKTGVGSKTHAGNASKSRGESDDSNSRKTEQGAPADAVEVALVSALQAATAAGRFDEAAQLARELQARHTTPAANIVPIEAARRKGKSH